MGGLTIPGQCFFKTVTLYILKFDRRAGVLPSVSPGRNEAHFRTSDSLLTSRIMIFFRKRAHRLKFKLTPRTRVGTNRGGCPDLPYARLVSKLLLGNPR